MKALEFLEAIKDFLGIDSIDNYDQMPDYYLLDDGRKKFAITKLAFRELIQRQEIAQNFLNTLQQKHMLSSFLEGLKEVKARQIDEEFEYKMRLWKKMIDNANIEVNDKDMVSIEFQRWSSSSEGYVYLWMRNIYLVCKNIPEWDHGQWRQSIALDQRKKFAVKTFDPCQPFSLSIPSRYINILKQALADAWKWAFRW